MNPEAKVLHQGSIESLISLCGCKIVVSVSNILDDILEKRAVVDFMGIENVSMCYTRDLRLDFESNSFDIVYVQDSEYLEIFKNKLKRGGILLYKGKIIPDIHKVSDNKDTFFISKSLFVIVFNQVTYLKNTINQLKRIPVIIDTGSTYPPIIDYYKKEHTGMVFFVNEKHRKLGPKCWIYDTLFFDLLPELFLLTDPDLYFSDKLPTVYLEYLIHLSDRYKAYKIGSALDVSGNDLIPGKYYNNMTIKEWESRFWKNKLAGDIYGNEFYIALIDTTFCLWNKKYIKRDDPDAIKRKHNPLLFGGLHIRINNDFLCKHLPWHTSNILNVPVEEIEYYNKVARCHSTVASGGTFK